MSRKAKALQDLQDGEELRAVRYWGASFGYSLPKESALVGRKDAGGLVVLLHLPDDPAAPECAGPAPCAGEVNPMRSLAPLARCALSAGPTGDGTAPPALVVLDLSGLFASPQEAREALDAEGEQAGEPGKALGKPAARALAKLLPKGATLAACGGAAQLALKLLCGSGPRLRQGAFSRLVLAHPRLPAKCVNALLVGNRFEQQLCAVFESFETQQRRLPMLQAAFKASSACHACAAPPQEALLRGLLGLDKERPLPEMPDATDADDVGRTLWPFDLSITMDPNSKQYRADIADASHLLEEEEEAHEGAQGACLDGSGGGDEEEEVAALVVRGCRCVLVRSLDQPAAWCGMRLPLASRLPDEEPQKAAVRAVSELCDIEGEEELVPLPLQPIDWHRQRGVARLFILKAVHPPPAGPLEDADMEDEEDLYDWYTWSRAAHALRDDPSALVALQSAALSLMAAGIAGRVPFEWGGIFGQDWTCSINAQGPVAMLMAKSLPQLPKVEPLHEGGVAIIQRTCEAAARGECNKCPNEGQADSEATTEAGREDVQERLPVTVISGFLGAGKTTLLKHILRSSGRGGTAGAEAPLNVAVIVNDMGEVNLDASEIKNTRLIQEEAAMVELHNGCICCTLRGDLLKTVKALSEEKAFDYLVIESTGISEPLPVAQTFVMDVDEAEQVGSADANAQEGPTEGAGKLRSLSHFARLDTTVTVVDALNIYDVLGSLETLAEKNITGMAGNAPGTWHEHGHGHGHGDHSHDHDHDHGPEEEAEDDRTIAQLMLDQIEFANVILLSKVHLVPGGASAVEETRTLLQKLNPSAQVIVPDQPHFAGLPLNAVINTNLFDMEVAQLSAGWVQELAKSAEGGAGHTPETEEYGIGSVVFRSRERPFHPGRLNAVLAGFGSYLSAAEANQAASPSTSRAPFSGVVRAKGQLWVASTNAHPVDFHAAGRHMQLAPSSRPYLAAVPRHEWDEDDHGQHEQLVAAGAWHKVHGDRESEVVFIGVGLEMSRILAELGAALLTDAEMAVGAAGWKAFEDVFFGGMFFDVHPAEGSDHAYALKLRITDV